MINLRRLPVPLIPHTPILFIYHYFNDPSSSTPPFRYEFYSFIHLISESNIIIGDFNIANNQSTNYSKSLLIVLASNIKLHNTYPNTIMVIPEISSFPTSHLA